MRVDHVVTDLEVDAFDLAGDLEVLEFNRVSGDGVLLVRFSESVVQVCR
jgi:hypothetical protein